MESKSNHIGSSDLFSKSKYLIIIHEIFQYFNLQDCLRLSNINSLIYKHVQGTINIPFVKKMNTVCKGRKLTKIKHYIKIITEIDTVHKELLYEYLCYMIFKHCFTKNEIEINGSSYDQNNFLNIFDYIGPCNINLTQYKTFSYYNIPNDWNNSLSIIKKNFRLFPKLANLELFSTGLNDECLGYLNCYLLQRDSQVYRIDIRDNPIGDGENSKTFLEILEHTTMIRHVYLDGCHYPESSFEIFLKIFTYQNNSIVELCYNESNFSMEVITDLWNKLELIEGKERLFEFSFGESPIFFLYKFQHGVKIEQKKSAHFNADFLEKYLQPLKYDRISLIKIYDSHIDNGLFETICKIFESSSLLHLNLFINQIPEDILEAVCKYIPNQDRLESIIIHESFDALQNLSNILEISAQNSKIRYYKLFTVYSPIDTWLPFLSSMIENNQIEKLFIKNCKQLGNVHLKALCESINMSSCITYFILEDCSFDEIGVYFAVEILKKSKTLAFIRLDKTNDVIKKQLKAIGKRNSGKSDLELDFYFHFF